MPVSEADETGPADLGGPARGLGGSPIRHTVEFLIVLLVGILFFRTFMAEAYIVPTGSMAPTLLGMHRAYTCPNCRFRYLLGMDESGSSGRPVCPNCGAPAPESGGVEGSGDRLLVQKFLFDLRPPHRWEAVVFQNPADPSQAYVKRVVGLPGESVLIRGGDLFIDGRIARKTLAEQRALRVLVYDHDHRPDDSARIPRWRFRLGGEPSGPSGWRPEGTRFVRDPAPGRAGRIDWIDYRHWEADRGNYGPVLDFLPYNGADLPGAHRVDDLMIEAEVAVGPGVQAVAVSFRREADRFLVTIPVDGRAGPTVQRNGRPLAIPAYAPALLASQPGFAPRHVHLEASLIDRRLLVALDGLPLFAAYDYDDPTAGPGPYDSPVGMGVQGSGRAEFAHVRVWRDIYYTDALASAPKPPFGVGEPYSLGAGEYFVLGDNSPVSNDSRFWAESPAVRRELLLGKPFLVHLPSQAVPLQVFGRELYWIPDPREIRYIR